MTDTTVETVTDTPISPPPPSTSPAAPGPAAAGLPGVPLAVAGANTVGLAVAGASALAGPVGLIAVGTIGLATVGTLAVRKARRRTTSRGGGGSHGHAGRGAARSTVAAARSTGSSTGRTTSTGRVKPATGTKAGRTGAFGSAGLSSPGAGSVRRQGAGSSPSLRGRGNTGPVSLSKTPRTGGTRSGLLRKALMRRQAGAPGRTAKATTRTADRTARGIAKAQRQTGTHPGKTGQHTPGGKAHKRALQRSALRHGARMVGAAGIAAGVGLVSGVWNWKRPGRAAGHMRAVWRRLTDRARRARAKRDGRINGNTTNTPKGVAVPAEVVNDPARRRPDRKADTGTGAPAAPVTLGKPHDPTVGGPVSGTESTTPFTRLSSAAEVMLQAASTFDPEHMNEFEALIDDLPDAMVTVQETLRVLAELSDEKLPVNAAVVEEIGEGYRAMNRVVTALEEVGAVYRRVHAEDIERNESPRNGIDGERRWNVG